MYQKVKSLVRALKIMELLREKSILNEYVSPQDAARVAGISTVSAYNILKTLEECGYVRHTGRGKYEEGGQGALPVLGSGIMPRLRELAKPLLDRAAASGNESFLLVTLNNGKRVELLRIGRIKNTSKAVFQANAEPYAMLKAGGRLMVIDGGFSEAYHNETGIAGYTLVYHSRGFQLVQHEPFTSARDAIVRETDIKSTTQIVEMSAHRMRVADTDKGEELRTQVADLKKLLYAYRHGILKEKRS